MLDLALSPEQAAAYARELGGKVALKVDSGDIQHKTEAGAVRLGLQEDEAVRQAYLEVIEAARSYCPRMHASMACWCRRWCRTAPK